MRTNTYITKLLKVAFTGIAALLLTTLTNGQELTITGSNGGEGSALGSFTITPSTAFTADGTITISFSGSTEEETDYTVSTKVISYFTNEASLTVPISVNDDNIVEPTETIILTIDGVTGSATIGASNNVSIDIVDNDIALLSIASSSPITETGTHNAFTVTSSNPIASNSDITITATGTATEGIDYNTLSSFYTLVAQETTLTIPITVTEDVLVEGNETITLTLTDPAATNINLGTSNISATITDDDNADFTISPTGAIAITEGATAQSFTIALAAQPISDVVISISSSNTLAATVDKATLTFTNTNWNTPQTVNINAPQDANLVNETVSITASVIDANSDDAFDPIIDKTITVNVDDDDSAGYTISTNSVNITEGSTQQFTITLTAEPQSNVVFDLTSSDINVAAISPAQVTFEPNNYNTAQTLTITCPEDPNLIGETATLTVAINTTGSDDAFDALADETVAVNSSDNDLAEYSVSTSNESITEGNSQQFTIVLLAEPQSNVVFDITSSNTNVVTSSNAQLTFEQANYDVPQTITLSCPEDVNLINETATITIAINQAASDNAFDALANETITVTSVDNGQAGFSISTNSIDIIEGNTLQFTLVLTAQPQSNVVFDVSSANTDIVTVSHSQLTFEQGNYGTPQTVTVTCAEDANIISETSSIVVAVNDAASDNAFDPLSNETITVTTTDNDDAGYAVSTNSINITEGNTEQFTLVLTAQPQSNVIFDLSSANTNVASLSKSQLTFEPSNYDVPQSVTLSCPEDVNLVGETTTITITVNNASDNAFDPLANETITVNSSDNDAPGYTVSTGSLAINEGDSQQFSVVLTAQPQNDVFIDLSSTNSTIATVSSTQLTFSNTNWNTQQHITVSVPEDNNLVNESTTIIASINNASDVDFTGIAGQTINISTTDNDTAPVFTSSPITDIDEDVMYSYSIVVSDVDNDIPIISLETPISWLSLTDNGDGTATLLGTPLNEDVATYTIRLRATDDLTFTEQTFQLLVNNINDAPVANNDSDTTSDVATVKTNVLANDVDDDNNINIASLKIVQEPYHGTASVEAGTGHIIFTPDVNYFGLDSYQYEICDTDGECDVATVTITIIDGNIKPVTSKDFITTNEDVAVEISPLSNDNDPNGNIDISSLNLNRAPEYGSYSINEVTATISYQPMLNYFGNDTIVYTVCDLGNPALCSKDSILITILPINDNPIATDQHLDVTEGIMSDINLAILGSDIENDVLSVEISPDTPEIPGTYSIINNTTLQFTAEFGSLCTDHEILYLLKDNNGGASMGTLFIHITALDSDLDNIPDAIEIEDGIELDSDSDGTPNYLDKDSDNDGISDAIEGGISNSCSDTLLDSDNDGIPDYIDDDSDNDTVLDNDEGKEDCDNDGIPNYRDSFDNCANRINAPSTFTPNGDGINDHFVIKGATSDELKDNELFIFNRWGAQVYHMVNYDNSWNGDSKASTLGSEKLSEGSYFYVFKTKGGKVLKGTVYIKR